MENQQFLLAPLILDKFVDSNGGYYNSFVIGTGANTSPKTIAANAAIVRGLYAAYNNTNDNNYLVAANTAYNYMINNFYSPSEKAFATTLGDNNAIYTPWNLALFAGATREASLTGNQTDAASIYTRVSKNVYNQMLLTEAEATGETGSDSDGDGIPYIVGGTKPFVFAESGMLTLSGTVGVNDFIEDVYQINIFPNPATDLINVTTSLKSSSGLEISIYDITGKEENLTMNKTSNNIRVDVSSLAGGTYFVRILQGNELIDVRKIVKQ